MAWTDLPTNYTDAVWDGMRKYNEITNDDGTVSFQDVTIYTGKEKSFFGAKDANAMNGAINTIMASITDLHPVGSLYISTDSTSPASLFGGTWEQIKSGFLATAGYSYQKWTYECAEKENFTLTKETKCRFGVDGSYIYKTLSAGTYSAVLSTFGTTDPARNVEKHVDIYKTITIAAGDAGGEASHTLAISELAMHAHLPDEWTIFTTLDGKHTSGAAAQTSSGIYTSLHDARNKNLQNTNDGVSEFTGESQPHNNMPPYLAVCVWKRIS